MFIFNLGEHGFYFDGMRARNLDTIMNSLDEEDLKWIALGGVVEKSDDEVRMWVEHFEKYNVQYSD